MTTLSLGLYPLLRSVLYNTNDHGKSPCWGQCGTQTMIGKQYAHGEYAELRDLQCQVNIWAQAVSQKEESTGELRRRQRQGVLMCCP